MRCLRGVSVSTRGCQGELGHSSVEHVLSRYPGPVLEGVFADAPATGEVAELANMAGVVGQGEGVLVVVEV